MIDMHTPEQRAAMLRDLVTETDPVLPAVEVMLLRSAFERVDDFLVWLDAHVARDHGEDESATAVLQFIGGVRNKLARELRVVDEALRLVRS